MLVYLLGTYSVESPCVIMAKTLNFMVECKQVRYYVGSFKWVLHCGSFIGSYVSGVLTYPQECR